MTEPDRFREVLEADRLTPSLILEAQKGRVSRDKEKDRDRDQKEKEKDKQSGDKQSGPPVRKQTWLQGLQLTRKSLSSEKISRQSEKKRSLTESKRPADSLRPKLPELSASFDVTTRRSGVHWGGSSSSDVELAAAQRESNKHPALRSSSTATERKKEKLSFLSESLSSTRVSFLACPQESSKIGSTARSSGKYREYKELLAPPSPEPESSETERWTLNATTSEGNERRVRVVVADPLEQEDADEQDTSPVPATRSEEVSGGVCAPPPESTNLPTPAKRMNSTAHYKRWSVNLDMLPTSVSKAGMCAPARAEASMCAPARAEASMGAPARAADPSTPQQLSLIPTRSEGNVSQTILPVAEQRPSRLTSEQRKSRLMKRRSDSHLTMSSVCAAEATGTKSTWRANNDDRPEEPQALTVLRLFGKKLHRKKQLKTISNERNESLQNASPSLSPCRHDDSSKRVRKRRAKMMASAADPAWVRVNISVLKACDFQPLIKALCDPINADLVSAIVSLHSVQDKTNTHVLETLLTANNALFSTIERLAAQEAEDAVDVATLYRGNSPTCRLLAAHMRLCGKIYLKDLLQSVVPLILEASPCEIDPSRVADADDVAANIAALSVLCQKIVDILMDSIPNVTLHVHRICFTLVDASRRSFPNSRSLVASGFFFLRYVCPAILNPQMSGCDIVLNDTHRRTLLLVSKTLQTLANGVLFGRKEGYMAPMNEFLAHNSSFVNDFFDKLLASTDHPSHCLSVPPALPDLHAFYVGILENNERLQGIVSEAFSVERASQARLTLSSVISQLSTTLVEKLLCTDE